MDAPATPPTGTDATRILRRARFSDYEAVLDMDINLYDDRDYMVAMFYEFLQSRHHIVYVVEQDDRLIMLSNYRVHNNTLVTYMSERVAKSHRGKGISRQEKASMTAQLLKLYPKVTHELVVLRMPPHLKATPLTSLYQWTVLIYTLSMTKLQQSLSQWGRNNAGRCIQPLDISFTRTTELLYDTDFFERLLGRYSKDFIPGQWNWRPMRIDDKLELKGLFATSSKVLITPEPGVKTPDAIGIEKKSESGAARDDDRAVLPHCPPFIDAPASLSYSTLYRCKAGIACETFYFGGDVPAIFNGHLFDHVRHLPAVVSAGVDAGIKLAVHLPVGVDANRLAKCVDEMVGETMTTTMTFVLGIRPFKVMPTTSKL